MKLDELKQLKFESDDDELKRKKHAEHLTKFIHDNDDIDVISVNSSWGTGKTWFVHMWINYIKEHTEYKEIIIPIYYNAWENDDFDNAFVPLLAEIDCKLFGKGLSPQFDNIKKAAGAIIKTGAINLISNATGGIVDLQAGIDALNDNEIYVEHIKKYNDVKVARTDFVRALESYTNDFEPPKKIFIFIDELDRCRPTFAIETLERIKHYFDVDGFHFILMLDSTQLSHSVKVLYGNDCDTTGYLMRFIDVEFNMPEPDTKYYFSQMLRQNSLTGYIDELTNIFKLSLRDYEKLRLWYKALLATPNTSVYNMSNAFPYYFAYMLLLKLKFPNVFNNLNDSMKLEEVKMGEMPFSTEIDNHTKKNGENRICKLMLIIFREHYHLDTTAYREDLSENEQEWLNYKGISDTIINGWKDVKFLSRFTD